MSLRSASQLRRHNRRNACRPMPSSRASHSQPSTSQCSRGAFSRNRSASRSRSRSRSCSRRGGLFALWLKGGCATKAETRAAANAAKPITLPLVDACGKDMGVGVHDQPELSLEKNIMVSLRITMSLLSRWGGDLCFWVHSQSIRIVMPTYRRSPGNHTLPTGNDILPTLVILPPGLGCHITFAIFGGRRLEVPPQAQMTRISMPSKPFNNDNEFAKENFDSWNGLLYESPQERESTAKYYSRGFVPCLFVGMMAITKEERDELKPRLLVRDAPFSAQFPRGVTSRSSTLRSGRVWWWEALEFTF